METLELPVVEELDEMPAVNLGQELDVAAFELWRQASCAGATQNDDDAATVAAPE